MKVLVKRIHKEPEFTVGTISVDGKPYGFTLEDTVREIPGRPVEAWKVQNKTAIPAGTYEVHITTSARFGRQLPILLNVPGFTGIRIHPGNASKDTEGCLLVGSTWGGGDWIANSRKAFNELYAVLLGAWARGEKITLEVG